MSKEFVPSEDDLRDAESLGSVSEQLRPHVRAPKQSQVEAEAAARKAHNEKIYKEINDTWGNKNFNREGSHEEIKALNTAISTFKSAPRGPKKEAARTSAWNIAQGIKANKGMTNPTRAIIPHGSEMPCGNGGCDNTVKYEGEDATCPDGKCTVPNTPVWRPRE